MSIVYFTWFLVDLKAPGKEEGLWYAIEVERSLSCYNAFIVRTVRIVPPLLSHIVSEKHKR